MSSGQNPPVPEWWKQPQDPGRDEGYEPDQGSQGYPGGQGGQGGQDYPGNRGYRGDQDYPHRAAGGGDQEPRGAQRYPADSQPTQWHPINRGSQSSQDSQATQHYPVAGRGFPDSPAAQRSPGGHGYQDSRDFPAGQGFPAANQGFPENQEFPAAQAYQGYQGGQTAPTRRRRRRRRWPLVTLIVIVLVLVIGDRAAVAFTEDQMASQVQSSLELSGKPKVTIQGIPFLTQLAARDFNTVDITASNEAAGPGGELEIASLTATLHGMHIHGFNSATIDQFNASALITFTALAHAGGVPQGITLSADGPDKIKASLDIGPFSESAVAQITQTGPGKINIKVLNTGGITSAVLGNLDFTVSIPKLPAGVSIQSISVTQQGLRITAAGKNTTLSQ